MKKKFQGLFVDDDTNEIISKDGFESRPAQQQNVIPKSELTGYKENKNQKMNLRMRNVMDRAEKLEFHKLAKREEQKRRKLEKRQLQSKQEKLAKEKKKLSESSDPAVDEEDWLPDENPILQLGTVIMMSYIT